MHHYTQQWSVLSDTGNTCEPQLLVSLTYIHLPVSDHPMFSQLTHLKFSCLLMSLQNIWAYVWHPFIATANLKCQGCTWQENIAAYSYVTPFHHQPLLCSYVCDHMCRQTDRQTQNQSTHSNARFLDSTLTDNIRPLQTIYVKGSSNIWAYPRLIIHINDEETMPIYVRSQTLQTKSYLLHGTESANQ
jgi:hypothetical protein